MVRTIKTIIKNLARNAVLIAEKEFGSGNGHEKSKWLLNIL